MQTNKTLPTGEQPRARNTERRKDTPVSGHVVKQEYVKDPRGDGMLWVSTVRLSVDHGYNGKPLWYETYIFPANAEGTEVTNWLEEWGDRYTTLEEAERGHEIVMATLRDGVWPS
jgi:hypothetical protein